MTDLDFVGFALVVGWGLGLVVGWWYRGARDRWRRSHTPATAKQIAYLERLAGPTKAAELELVGLTVEEASALIAALKAAA